jgi:hypothetical protein
MLHADLADTSLASEWPDIAGGIDELPEYLREQIAELNSPLPRTFAERTQQFLRLLAAAMKEANMQVAERQAESSTAPLNADLVEGLRVLSSDEEKNRQLSFRAACVLKQLGLDPRTDQQLADDYGVVTTRAAAHAIRRKVEKQTGLRSRSSKTDTTRERCRARRLGQKRPRAPWQGGSSWVAALRNLTAPLELIPTFS